MQSIILRLAVIIWLGLSVAAFGQTKRTETATYETGYFHKVKQSELSDVIRVIYESEIRLRGANNLKDLLMMETGGIFYYDAVKGWQFQWHGSSKGNILILIDGLPFRSGQFDEQDLQQIPLDNISRIEITENPQGVAYGSSAIMMVLNIVFKASQTKVYKPSLRFQVYHPGSIYTNLNLGRRTTENFFRFSSSVDAFAGIQGNDSGRVLQWLPYTRFNNHLFFSHKILQYLDLSFGLNNMFESKTQLGYPYPQTVRAYDRETRTHNNALFAGIKGRLNRYFSLQGDVQWMAYRRQNTLLLKDISTAEQMAVNDTALNDTLSYHMLFSRWVLTRNDKNRQLNYQVGFDISSTSDRYKPVVNHIHQSSTTTALFAVFRYVPLNGLMLNGGFRLPYNARYNTKPLWDFKLNYNFSNRFRLKFIVAQSSKAPTFDQMFATYLTNGYSIKRNLNLTDENVLSYHYSLLFRTGQTLIEPGFFNYVFKNGIELTNDKVNPGRLIHKNISEKKCIGTRINVEQRTRYYDVNLRLILTGNNHFANLFDRQFFFQEVYSNITLKIERYDLNLCFVNKLTSLRGYMGLDAAMGAQTYFNSKFHLADAVIEKAFSKKTIVIRTGLKNIFNVTNIDSYFMPFDLSVGVTPVHYQTALLPGRNFMVELSINL